MTDSRQIILQNIREGLRTALLPDSSRHHPQNTVPGDTGGLESFIEEIEKLSGIVIRTHAPEETIAKLFDEHGWQQALVWDWENMGCADLEKVFTERQIDVFSSGHPADLAHIPVGLTGAEAALADTGTIVVRNKKGQSSLASLLPPVHVALLNETNLFPDMRSYFEEQGNIQDTSNLVFISGPSRTADIEQTLTLGVHGPRELIVVLWS